VNEAQEQVRIEAELASLRASAQAGQDAAQLALGSRLLIGRQAPLAPQEGLALIQAAAGSGNAEAVTLMATLTAAGAFVPQSWDGALDLLAQGAALGSALARGQVELLAGAGPGGDGPEPWAHVQAAVDLAPWLAPPTRRGLCEAPRIRACEGFIPPAVCDWLIGRARGRLQPAMMTESYGAKPRLVATRTNSDFIFDILNADVVVVLLRARIEALTRMPVAGMEPPQIMHYDSGQELRPHFDFLQRNSDGTGYQGDRIATFLIYLNEDYEGGETDFPRVPLRHKGAKGDAFYFANVDAAGAQDPLTLHAGLPPTRGEKWLFSQWIHDRPFSA
jgi:prolyl 4-hydroxylase